VSILVLIDVGLGLVLYYLVLSLICAAVAELIATVTRLRAATLRAGLANLFDGTDLLTKVYDAPLIKGLFRHPRPPAEIPPTVFATTLVHVVAGATVSCQSLMNAINALPDSPIKGGLATLLDDAKLDVDKLKAGIETWFNASMERVSGWYKRSIQLITLGLALALVAGINADTIQLVRTISLDPALRASLAQKALEVASQDSPPATPQTVAEIGKQISDLGLFGVPLGWATAPSDASAWLLKVVGLLLTAAALTLGAPFWFDVLKQLANLRSSLRRQSGSESDQAAPGS